MMMCICVCRNNVFDLNMLLETNYQLVFSERNEMKSNERIHWEFEFPSSSFSLILICNTLILIRVLQTQTESF